VNRGRDKGEVWEGEVGRGEWAKKREGSRG